ncbi:MAG: cytidine deaminase [Oscillospiraceae bacterium]|nr:cytidine deaminase [Oscillospiraceae bacterium]
MFKEGIMDKTMKDQLVAAAWKAREHSYSPYSRFKVGAAVLGTDGKIYTGANIENMSYGATICAERCSLFTMVASGCPKYEGIAIATELNEDGAPCLACRQVMTEFCASLDIPVLMATPGAGVFEHTLREIAPLPCMPNSLPPDKK